MRETDASDFGSEFKIDLKHTFYLDVWVVHDKRWWHLQSQVIVLPPVQHEGNTLFSNHLTERHIWRQRYLYWHLSLPFLPLNLIHFKMSRRKQFLPQVQVARHICKNHVLTETIFQPGHSLEGQRNKQLRRAVSIYSPWILISRYPLTLLTRSGAGRSLLPSAAMDSWARTSSRSISFSITCRNFGENSVTSSRQAVKSCRAWAKSCETKGLFVLFTPAVWWKRGWNSSNRNDIHAFGTS